MYEKIIEEIRKNKHLKEKGVDINEKGEFFYKNISFSFFLIKKEYEKSPAEKHFISLNFKKNIEKGGVDWSSTEIEILFKEGIEEIEIKYRRNSKKALLSEIKKLDLHDDGFIRFFCYYLDDISWRIKEE